MTKNKRSSQRYHSSRSLPKSSKLSSNKNRERKIFSIARKSILTIIVLSMLIVILAVLLISFEKPEKLVKQKLADITSDYYENYYYPNLIGNTSNEETLTDIMSPYVTPGFASISLRQLLLFDNERFSETATFLKDYCDENKTFAHIYPETPFGKKNYRIEYVYSCSF